VSSLQKDPLVDGRAVVDYPASRRSLEGEGDGRGGGHTALMASANSPPAARRAQTNDG
jgi:hypothetical protein